MMNAGHHGEEYEGSGGEEQDGEEWDNDDDDSHLPTVPLMPFRNQVGGHSAIYKFTKRAVCKVSFSFPFFLSDARVSPGP